MKTKERIEEGKREKEKEKQKQPDKLFPRRMKKINEVGDINRAWSC